ncbi:hypothetical protein KSP39_PZI019534 [Platanthera zijinensis]|uniref:Uncharacterized protein n=1 Tax=Platanthera zijinensis TaxID=2320716 RepID=A0AAP0B1N9_9ASPA
MAGGRGGSQKVQALGLLSGAGGAATVTTADGQVLTLSEYISLLEEGARRRVEIMNKKMRDLETEMEALETKLTWASECS